MANITGVPERAVVMRINRALRPEYQQLKKARGMRMQLEVGDYFLLDLHRNLILDTHVQVEALGRLLGVLESWENVAS